MGIIPKFLSDSFLNLLTGLGGNRDKGAPATVFTYAPLSRDQQENAYRGNWIARKAIDIPCEDMTREWRSWQASKEQITQIEKAERKYRVRPKVREAMLYGRLYGGGALILGVDGNMDEPLEVEKVKKDGLLWMHAMSRYELNYGPMISDLNDPFYGHPEFWERATGSPTAGKLSTNPINGGRRIAGADIPMGVRIHPSRVIRFLGAPRPDAMTAQDPWSDSIIDVIANAIKDALNTSGSLAHLIGELKVDILKIPDLAGQVSSEESEKLLMKRLVYGNDMKSIAHALLLDKDDDWSRPQLDLSGVPDALLVFLMIVSAAVDIPATRFLSQSPKGLNATGESDLENYDNRLKGDQEADLTPQLETVDDVLLYSTFGTRDDKIYYEWNPLRQMSAKEEGEINKSYADTFKIDNDAGLINPDALRRARINQLIELGTYPGLEAAIDEFGEEPPEPEVDPIALAAQRLLGGGTPNAGGARPALPARKPQAALPAPSRQRAGDEDVFAVGDAIPRPLYIRRDLLPESAKAFTAWAKEQGFKDIQDDLHVTLLYCVQPVDWMRLGVDDWGNDNGELIIPPGGPRVVEALGGQGAIVLHFSSNRLTWRNRSLVASCGPADDELAPHLNDYQPHVTITYNIGDVDLREVEPYRGELRFGPEIFEEIDIPDDLMLEYQRSS